MSTQELISKEIENLPEALQREVYDFVRFLREKSDERFNGLLLSESTLAKDWETPEEDAAWANL
jgi:Protein of unknown function (DUF2281)